MQVELLFRPEVRGISPGRLGAYTCPSFRAAARNLFLVRGDEHADLIKRFAFHSRCSENTLQLIDFSMELPKGVFIFKGGRSAGHMGFIRGPDGSCPHGNTSTVPCVQPD